MTKPLFTITFTAEQAVDFIKQQIKDNYSSLDNFDVVIQQKTMSDVNLENPWLIPDEDSSVKTTTGFSDKPVVEFTVDSSVINPWLTPDENGWFTHDPNWKAVDCPPYITGDRKVFVILHDYNNPNDIGEFVDFADIGEFVDFADSWNWSVDGNSHDITKWKYVD